MLRIGRARRGRTSVKRNAIAGRCFESFAALEAHLDAWVREVADVRIHGTTGEAPAERFAREEAPALRPIAGLASFQALRELTRKVQVDCTIEVDGNAYSVPWRLIGEQVRVTVTPEVLRVVHAGREVAVHAREAGRRRRVVDAAHFEGVVGFRSRIIRLPAPKPEPALLRPLAEYEALVGGGF